MEWLKINWDGLLNFLKNFTALNIWESVFAVSLILYFSDKFGFITYYASYIWIIFLLLIVSGVILFRRFSLFFYNKRQIKNKRNSIIQQLDFLNEEELEILQIAVSSNTRTLPCGPHRYQAFISLTQKGIMEGWGQDIRVPGTIVLFVWENLITENRFK